MDINEKNNNGNDICVGSIENSIEDRVNILKIECYITINDEKEPILNIGTSFSNMIESEEFKTNGYSILLMKYGDRIKTNFKLEKAIEHILSDYKRVLKENEEYSKQLDLDYVDKNYISKQKIKDEIEELKGKLEDISRRREKSKTKDEETVLWCLEIRIDERIKTLQELL